MAQSKGFWAILKDAFRAWRADKASRLAAAMSYYALFSIAPLLVVVIAIVGLVLGRQAAQGQIVSQIGNLIGPSAAATIQSMIANTRSTGANIFATVVGIVILLLGATALFSELQDALNTIWHVKEVSQRGAMGLVRKRLLSFVMILGIGLLLLVSLVISAALSALSAFFTSLLPGPSFAFLLQAANFLISFAVITVLFALVYKILPDAQINWRDVWIGAAVTAVLFVIGKTLIGLYLGSSSVASIYGAAGSLVIILLWVYYSAQILFFGAEFAKVYALRAGIEILPAHGVVLTPAEESAQGRAAPRPQPAGRAPAQGAALGAVAAPLPVPVTGPGAGTPARRLQDRQAAAPRMPFPVRVMTAVAAAWVAALAVSGLLLSRSRAKRIDLRLLNASRHLTEESERLKQEALRMQGASSNLKRVSGRMDDTRSKMSAQSAKMRETGRILRSRAEIS